MDNEIYSLIDQIRTPPHIAGAIRKIVKNLEKQINRLKTEAAFNQAEIERLENV
jgi:hypothetical protein